MISTLMAYSIKHFKLPGPFLAKRSSVPYTVMILSVWTDVPGQTVQTQISLLLEEQSDQDLHCLPFRLHYLNSLLCGRAT